jgi:ATP-dependent DNA helicase RecG
MNAEAKDKSMQKFKEGEVNILVATTVIEVGIDVPEATLIIIENAEKFGLAQLHQLRGRVGRGRLQSYCVLLYNPKRVSNASRTRLEIMRNSNDGFYIAEQDLVLRGSGDILGTKQSGEPEFFFANLASDLNILLEANKLASSIEYTKPGILDLVNLKVKLFARRDTETLAIG